MGFDLTAIRSCFSLLLFSLGLSLLPVDTKTGGRHIEIGTQVIFNWKEFKAMENEKKFTCHETNSVCKGHSNICQVAFLEI